MKTWSARVARYSILLTFTALGIVASPLTTNSQPRSSIDVCGKMPNPHDYPGTASNKSYQRDFDAWRRCDRMNTENNMKWAQDKRRARDQESELRRRSRKEAEQRREAQQRRQKEEQRMERRIQQSQPSLGPIPSPVTRPANIPTVRRPSRRPAVTNETWNLPWPRVPCTNYVIVGGQKECLN